MQTDSKKAIVCGTTNSTQNPLPTYGGFSKKTKALVLPNRSFQECDHFNGNCVLIPDEVFKLVGNLDPLFHHALGDFDYGLRAKKMGVKLIVAPDYIATCEIHPNLPQWRSPSVSFINRMRFLYSASSGCYPPQFFVFDKRHNGFLKAVFHFFTIHLRAIIPALWNFKSY